MFDCSPYLPFSTGAPDLLCRISLCFLALGTCVSRSLYCLCCYLSLAAPENANMGILGASRGSVINVAAQVKPLLEAIGQGILDCGDDARAGSAMKLVGNFFISSWIELAAEGMTLGEKNGVARETVLDFITKLFPGFITTGTPLYRCPGSPTSASLR